MKTSINKNKVCWEELLPKEFIMRQKEMPLVYLPLGICEPHGHIAPFGLDTLKAAYLCKESAKRFGGIVAPTLGYQIHESGYHARWLEDVVGEVNPFMTAMPPDVMLRFFLYQLRAFCNAGFKSIIVITGHSGGNQNDFRLVANSFEKETGINVIVKSDPELVLGKYKGDHAGKYEISQLLYLHPELMDMNRLLREKIDILGRFAQGEDAHEASAKLGKGIIEASLSEIESIIKSIGLFEQTQIQKLNYQQTELIWKEIISKKQHWTTTRPRKGQQKVSKGSQWLPYQNSWST